MSTNILLTQFRNLAEIPFLAYSGLAEKTRIRKSHSA